LHANYAITGMDVADLSSVDCIGYGARVNVTDDVLYNSIWLGCRITICGSHDMLHKVMQMPSCCQS
jgi:hypothetical protein